MQPRQHSSRIFWMTSANRSHAAERHGEFDLAGMPASTIPFSYLEQLGKHLRFESILRYVALPNLTVEVPTPRKSNGNFSSTSRTEKASATVASLPSGRSDLVVIFDWLWQMGVREIIEVLVIEDRNQPHADSAIVEALYGFGVEKWDWKRVDLCSDVIYECAPNVKTVSLYSSGNNAVLMGWGSEEGLGNRKKFPRVGYLFQGTSVDFFADVAFSSRKLRSPSNP